jgi:hypothetical protein
VGQGAYSRRSLSAKVAGTCDVSGAYQDRRRRMRLRGARPKLLLIHFVVATATTTKNLLFHHLWRCSRARVVCIVELFLVASPTSRDGKRRATVSVCIR